MKRAQLNMSWQSGLAALARNGRGNHGRAVSVAHIVLQDHHRADTALL